jgi:hypothetical protein
MNITDQTVFFIALVALMVYVIRKARRWANAPISPVVNLQSGLIVDPGLPPTPAELTVFREIQRRRGLPGLAVAGVAYLIVGVGVTMVLPLVTPDVRAKRRRWSQCRPWFRCSYMAGA